MEKSRNPRPSEAELTYHRREWRVQRVGWAVMALIVAAAMAGLFGAGPLSDMTAGDPDRGTVEYQRFTRYGAESPLEICAPRSTTDPSRLQVRIPRDYFERFEIRSVVPEARAMEGNAREVEFAFDVSAQRSCVVFRMEPRRVGTVRALISIGADHAVAVHQFVYP